jgi:hypothetical protein
MRNEREKGRLRDEETTKPRDNNKTTNDQCLLEISFSY